MWTPNKCLKLRYTRDNREAYILAEGIENEIFSIVAIIVDKDGRQNVHFYRDNGTWIGNQGALCKLDLEYCDQGPH